MKQLFFVSFFLCAVMGAMAQEHSEPNITDPIETLSLDELCDRYLEAVEADNISVAVLYVSLVISRDGLEHMCRHMLIRAHSSSSQAGSDAHNLIDSLEHLVDRALAA